MAPLAAAHDLGAGRGRAVAQRRELRGQRTLGHHHAAHRKAGVERARELGGAGQAPPRVSAARKTRYSFWSPVRPSAR